LKRRREIEENERGKCKGDRYLLVPWTLFLTTVDMHNP
jgi:hypothetical protein